MSVSFHIDTRYDGEDPAQHCNFSNTNAVAIMAMLDIPRGDDGDLCGDLAHNKLASLRQRIVRARNLSELRRPALREACTTLGAGPTFIECGTTDESVMLRLAALERVVVTAQEMGIGIAWC